MGEAATYFVVNFTKASVPKNHPYTIKFNGYIPVYGSREYVFQYKGSDLETDFALSDRYKGLLMEELAKDYGYGSYDNRVVKEQLKKKNQYRIKQEYLEK